MDNKDIEMRQVTWGDLTIHESFELDRSKGKISKVLILAYVIPMMLIIYGMWCDRGQPAMTGVEILTSFFGFWFPIVSYKITETFGLWENAFLFIINKFTFRSDSGLKNIKFMRLHSKLISRIIVISTLVIFFFILKWTFLIFEYPTLASASVMNFVNNHGFSIWAIASNSLLPFFALGREIGKDDYGFTALEITERVRKRKQREETDKDNSVAQNKSIAQDKNKAKGEKGEADVQYTLKWWAAENNAVNIEKDCKSVYSSNCIRLASWDDIKEPQEYDHLMVTSFGVIHIETKAYGGQIKVIDDDSWIRAPQGVGRIKMNMMAPSKSPAFQVRNHEYILKCILPENVPVISFICIADESAMIYNAKKSSIPIVSIRNLNKHLNSISERMPPMDADIADIVKIIDSKKVKEPRKPDNQNEKLIE